MARKIIHLILVSVLSLSPLMAAPSGPEVEGFTNNFVNKLQAFQSDTGAANDLATALGTSSPLPTTFNLVIKCAELSTRLANGDFKGVAWDGLQTLGEYGLEKAADVFAAAKAVNVIYACAKLGKYAGENFKSWQQDMYLENAYADYASEGQWTAGGSEVTRAFHLDRLSKIGLTELTGKKDARGNDITVLKGWVSRYFSERYALEQQAKNMGSEQANEDVKKAKKEIFKKALPQIYPGLKGSSAAPLAELIVEKKVTRDAVLGIVSQGELAAMATAGPVKALKKQDASSGEARPVGTPDEVIAYINAQKSQVLANAILYGTFAENLKKTSIDVRRTYGDVIDQNKLREDRARVEAAEKAATEMLLSALKNSGFAGLIESVPAKGTAALKVMETLSKTVFQAHENEISRFRLPSLNELNGDIVRPDLIKNPEATRESVNRLIQSDIATVQKELAAYGRYLAAAQDNAEVAEGKQLVKRVSDAANDFPGLVSVYYRNSSPTTVAEINQLLKKSLAGKRPMMAPQGFQGGEMDLAPYYQAGLITKLKEYIIGRKGLLNMLSGNVSNLDYWYANAKAAIPLIEESKKTWKEAEALLDKMRMELQIHGDYLEGGVFRLGDGITYLGKTRDITLIRPDYPYPFELWKKADRYNEKVDRDGTKNLEFFIQNTKDAIAFIDSLPKDYARKYQSELDALNATLAQLREQGKKLGYGEYFNTLDSGVNTERFDKQMKEVYQRRDQLKKNIPVWEEYLKNWKDLMASLKIRDARQKAEQVQTAKRQEEERKQLEQQRQTTIVAGAVAEVLKRPATQDKANAETSPVLEAVLMTFKKATAQRNILSKEALQLEYNKAKRAVNKAGTTKLDEYNRKLWGQVNDVYSELSGGGWYSNDTAALGADKLPELKKVYIHGRRWNDVDAALAVFKDDLADGTIEIKGAFGRGSGEFYTNGRLVGKTRAEVNGGLGWQAVNYNSGEWSYRFAPRPGSQTVSVRAINPGNVYSDPLEFPPITLTYADESSKESAVKALELLAQNFERKNITGFMGMISDDFYGGKDVLQDNLKRFLDATSALRFQIVADSFQINKTRRFLSAHWERSFLVNSTARQVDQSGSSTFLFDAGSGKLLAIKGDALFVPVTDTFSSQDLVALSGGGTPPLETKPPLPAGEASLVNEYSTQTGFKFGANGVVSIMSSPDFWWNDDGIMPAFDGGIRDLGANDIGNITSVPTSGYGTDAVPAMVGHIYAVKTRAGNYAVIEITDIQGTERIYFNWKYQPDGTAIFW